MLNYNKINKKVSRKKIRLGISVGDLNGIGMEIIAKTFSDSRIFEFCIPVLFASNQFVRDYLNKIGFSNFNFNSVDRKFSLNSKKLNVYNSWEKKVQISFGKETEEGGKYAYLSLKNSVEALKSNQIDVLVTAPINKKNIQSENFKFQGHTEFLSDYFSSKNAQMIMVSDFLKISLMTGHVSLSSVKDFINEKLIKEKILLSLNSLKLDFNIVKPKIAILGIDPHLGDQGVIGNVDEKIIKPAINKIFENGDLVFGPYSSDGYFASQAYKNFDLTMAVYHDQGLIPFKLISFGGGVNYTSNLSIIRTSPDHGVAYNISGRNIANEGSFREAVFLACKIYTNRNN